MVDVLNIDSIQVMQAVPWGFIIPALVSMMGLFKGGGSDASGAAAQMSPEMREMFNIQLGRIRKQEPLYQDVMGMARGLLPTRYRNSMPYQPGGGPGGGGVIKDDTGQGTGQGPNNPHGPDFNPSDPGSNPNPPPPEY